MTPLIRTQPKINNLSRHMKGATMEYHFEVLRSRNASNKVHFWWRIRSSNWKTLSSSETYTTKNNCLRVINPMMKRIGKKYCDYTYIDLTEGE